MTGVDAQHEILARRENLTLKVAAHHNTEGRQEVEVVDVLLVLGSDVGDKVTRGLLLSAAVHVHVVNHASVEWRKFLTMQRVSKYFFVSHYSMFVYVCV